MINDYEEGELKKLYLAKCPWPSSEYFVEPTKERLAETIRDCVFGRIPEKECKTTVEIFEINLENNVKKMGEFPNESLDEILGEDENGT